MKIIRFKADGKIRYGILTGESIRGIEGTPFLGALKPIDETFKLSGVKFLAPVLPSKIVAMGLNYLSHVKEFNLPQPKVPLFFIKPSTSVIGPLENIIYPPSSHRVDYEAELGVVIGKMARRVTKEQAMEYVIGRWPMDARERVRYLCPYRPGYRNRT